MKSEEWRNKNYYCTLQTLCDLLGIKKYLIYNTYTRTLIHARTQMNCAPRTAHHLRKWKWRVKTINHNLNYIYYIIYYIIYNLNILFTLWCTWKHKTVRGARCAVVRVVFLCVFECVFWGGYLFGNSLTFSYLCNVFETRLRAEDEGRKNKCVWLPLAQPKLSKRRCWKRYT